MRRRRHRLLSGIKVRWDLSAVLLLVSNAVPACLAVAQRWNVIDLVVVYWAQSVTIGFFNWKLLRLLEDRRSEADARFVGRHSDSWFFALHYGLFHFVYMVFLAIGVVSFGLDSPWIIVGILAFIANHAISYWFSLRDDRTRGIDPNALFFFPYARILPMHLTIILGAFFSFYLTPNNRAVLLFFLVLKTVADMIMHFAEKNLVDKRSEVVLED